jgi:DNA-binding transcriptional LysR family regulator
VPRFTLRQLEYFQTAARIGSFAGAAAELHVSATAVAAAVGDLERALGVQLCLRHKAQGITLSTTGLWLLGEISSLLADAVEIERAVVSTDGVLRGPVAIGCYSTMAPSVIPELAAGFQAQHPDVELTFFDGSADQLLDQLWAGRLDVVITYRLGLPDGLDEAKLFDTGVNVLLAADHALAAAAAVPLTDLAAEPFIMLDLAPGGRHNLEILSAANVTPQIRHRSSNVELVRSMVARGLGYSLLVHRPHNDRSYEGLPLVSLPIGPEPVAVSAVIVWPTDVRLTRRARAVVEFAQRTLTYAPRSAQVAPRVS